MERISLKTQCSAAIKKDKDLELLWLVLNRTKIFIKTIMRLLPCYSAFFLFPSKLALCVIIITKFQGRRPFPLLHDAHLIFSSNRGVFADAPSINFFSEWWGNNWNLTGKTRMQFWGFPISSAFRKYRKSTCHSITNLKKV